MLWHEKGSNKPMLLKKLPEQFPAKMRHLNASTQNRQTVDWSRGATPLVNPRPSLRLQPTDAAHHYRWEQMWWKATPRRKVGHIDCNARQLFS